MDSKKSPPHNHLQGNGLNPISEANLIADNSSFSGKRRSSAEGLLFADHTESAVGTKLEPRKALPVRTNGESSKLMLREVDTRDPMAVAAQVRADYQSMFVDADRLFVPQALFWAIDCFNGRHPDFLSIDTRYHDLEHTLQGTLCLSALLRGRHAAGEGPPLQRSVFELAILAILFHDTGYLKRRDDTTGTGAKYTVTHVNRSCEFAEMFLTSKGYRPGAIRSVQNMIRCTRMGGNVTEIPFQTEAERIGGFALGTADLIGQMAASDYVDKLPGLYEEFLEAGRFNGNSGAVGFASVADLVQKTPGFWEKYVFPKITSDFRGLFRFLAEPAPHGANGYLSQIEANLGRIRESSRSSMPVLG